MGDEQATSVRWRLAKAARVEAAVVGLAGAAIVFFVFVQGWVGAPVDDVEGCDHIVAFALAAPGDPPTPLRSIDTLIACERRGTAHHPELRDAIRASVVRDAGFIAVYGPLLFWLAVRLGGWRPAPKSRRPRLADITSTYHGRLVATLAKWSVVAAVLLDVIENALLWRTAGELASPNDIVVSLTASAAIGKFALLVLPVVFGVRAFGGLVAAGIRSSRPEPLVRRVVPAAEGEARRWNVPVRRRDPEQDLVAAPRRNARDRYGIALSGGGIRSATFALGGLQVLDALPATSKWRLRDADYVSAVSGGSYMASAYQFLAMQRAGRNLASHLMPFGGSRTEPDAQDATRAADRDQLVKPAGDVEGHFRRHSMHLADGAAEWAMAIGEIAVKAASGLVLLLLAVWAVGLPVGWTFRYVLHGVDADGQPAPSLDLRVVAVPLLAYLVLATVQWFAAGADSTRSRRSAAGRTVVSRDGARQTTLFALALTVSLAVALPFLAANIERAVDKVADAVGLSDEPDEPSRADGEDAGDGGDGADGEDPPIAWAGLVAIVTAVGGVVGKRKLATTKATEQKSRPKSDLARRLGFGSRIEVLAGIVSVAVLAIALSDVVVDAWQRGASGPMKIVFEADAWQWWVASLLGLAIAYVIVNVNVWSLRPFYHRRLWQPYAVTIEGDTADWWTEARLSIVGRKLDDFPELLICAAAQTSGRDMAPPGRRALPFVFSAEACGGPDLGYVSTDTLEQVLGRERRKTITLFGAMATSGAAFGPAMGRHSKGGLGAVMAIANARLGAWLPNPRHLADVVDDGAPFRASSLATWPRLSYWAREIVGQYPVDAKLTLVTDGGHVENLGLLELLRRRCTRIICLDASGAGATPTTLAEAISLAREELGVEITLRIPGEDDIPLIDLAFGADPLRRKGGGDDLASRIAAHPVLEGVISYPPVGRQPATTGRLFYGTLALAGTDAADWDVLEYAQRNPLFPNDGTDQQWFRADTFTAYQQLGRRTMERILDVAGA